jgi:methylated-DNA-[protein]-cysteine S-methyltransferase
VLGATRNGICYAKPATTEEQGLQDFRRWGDRLQSLYIISQDPTYPVLRQACTELAKYLEGLNSLFKVRLELLTGTDFQHRVWDALQAIPYGETRTYAEVARMIGSDRAYRAVGTANAQNPIFIFIPCHRVVAQKGLGGYSGGLEMKQGLLRLEQAN